MPMHRETPSGLESSVRLASVSVDDHRGCEMIAVFDSISYVFFYVGQLLRSTRVIWFSVITPAGEWVIGHQGDARECRNLLQCRARGMVGARRIAWILHRPPKPGSVGSNPAASVLSISFASGLWHTQLLSASGRQQILFHLLQ